MEHLRAVVLAAGLGKGDFGHRDARFGTRQLSHFGHNLDRGDDVSLAHALSRFLADGGDDARNLGLDKHFVAGLYLARGDDVLPEGVELGLHDGVDRLLGAGLLPQKPERAEQQCREKHARKDFEEFFHSRIRFVVVSILRVWRPPP